jgi:hypothetical protein
MNKRLFIIKEMLLFQNKRPQRNLKALHPIVWNIDKHKDCIGLGVGSTLTLRLNPTVTPNTHPSLVLPTFQLDASKSVKKQPCCAYFGKKLAKRIFIL